MCLTEKSEGLRACGRQRQKLLDELVRETEELWSAGRLREVKRLECYHFTVNVPNDSWHDT